MATWVTVLGVVIFVKILVDMLRLRRSSDGLDRFDFKAAKSREFTAR